MRYTLDFGNPLPPGWAELADQDHYWNQFTARFGFRLGITESTWPEIAEPTPSMTLDLTAPVDVECAWNSRFDAAVHAATCDAEWRVPVHPNGDYYFFLRTPATWLPLVRVDGRYPRD